MLTASPVRRVVLVVLDGLRPDAIPRFGLTHLTRLAHVGASTMLGRTVSPSVTACAMASLLTGAAPERHGLQGDRFHIPRPRGMLHPLPRMLADHSLPTSAFLATMPMLFTGIAHRMAAHLGIQHAPFRGGDCAEILDTAQPTLRDQRRGLIVLHLPDADRAGHASGWMSDAYAVAARRMDATMGRVLEAIDVDDPDVSRGRGGPSGRAAHLRPLAGRARGGGVTTAVCHPWSRWGRRSLRACCRTERCPGQDVPSLRTR